MKVLNIIVILIVLIVSSGIIYEVYTLYKFKLKQSTKISIKESIDLAGVPVVTFNCGNLKLNFLLDTGSTVSFLNKEVIEQIPHGDFDRQSSVIGLGNSTEAKHCKIELEYKGMKFEDMFGVIDLSATFNSIKEDTGISLHGILGVTFLEKYKYILDFNSMIFYR